MNIKDAIKILEEADSQHLLSRVDSGSFFNTEWKFENFGLSNQIIVLGNGFRLSEHAFNQLWKRIAYDVKVKSSGHLQNRRNAANYFWQFPGALETHMSTHILEQAEARSKSKKRDDNDIFLNVHNNVITAIHSTNYRSFDNLSVLRELDKQIDSGLINAMEVNVSLKNYNDEMRVQVLTDKYDHEYTIYGSGVWILNSQNGVYSFTEVPFVKSTVCDNSIVGMFGKTIRHVADVEERAKSAIQLIPELSDLATNTYLNYLNTVNTKIIDMIDVVTHLKRIYQIPKAVALKMIEDGFYSERDDIEDTLFNLISGLTYIANLIHDPNKEMRLLKLAGRLTELHSAGVIDSSIILEYCENKKFGTD